MLVGLRRKYLPQLRADFRRFYGLDFDDYVRGAFVQAADLAACLPQESSVYRAVNPGWRWGLAEHLAAAQLDVLRLLYWAKTKDAAKGRNRPKPLPRPGVGEPKNTGPVEGTVSVSVDEVKRRLALPRK